MILIRAGLVSCGWELAPLWPETVQTHENDASPGQAVTFLVLLLPYLAVEIFKENKKESYSLLFTSCKLFQV